MNADKELLLHVLSGGRVLEDSLQPIADDGLSLKPDDQPSHLNVYRMI